VDPEEALRLVEADALAHSRVEEPTVAQVAALYRGVEDWYDHDEIRQVAEHAGQTVRASSQTVVSLADAGIVRAVTALVGAAQRPAGALRVAGPLRMGVAGWDSVYGRVADTVRLRVHRGEDLTTALDVGLQRADAMVRTDLSLARRAQWRRALSANPKVIGQRRVIHPERSAGGVCGLCIAAADRVYYRDELLPIHDRCKCTVLPILKGFDPGRTLNDDDLAEVYGSAKSNRAADLKRVRYRVREHGELGPVLTDADHHWRGPAEVAAA
jgi:hypothetical protein